MIDPDVDGVCHEVRPRDGLQIIPTFFPTDEKNLPDEPLYGAYARAGAPKGGLVREIC